MLRTMFQHSETASTSDRAAETVTKPDLPECEVVSEAGAEQELGITFPSGSQQDDHMKRKEGKWLQNARAVLLSSQR